MHYRWCDFYYGLSFDFYNWKLVIRIIFFFFLRKLSRALYFCMRQNKFNFTITVILFLKLIRYLTPTALFRAPIRFVKVFLPFIFDLILAFWVVFVGCNIGHWDSLLGLDVVVKHTLFDLFVLLPLLLFGPTLHCKHKTITKYEKKLIGLSFLLY